MQPSSVETLEVRRVQCSFQEILADALVDAQPWAIGKGVEIEHEFCGVPLESISTDPDHLRQLLTGLISSAVRLTDADSLCLLVRAGRNGDAQMRIHLDVLDPTTKITDEADNEQPAGLGFSTWTQLAQLLGGWLVIDRLASSTRYRLTVAAGPIPDEACRPTENGTPKLRTLKESSPVDQRPVLLDRHVLLVEDDPDHRPLLSLMLRKAGCKVTVAENGKVALDLVRDAGGNGHSIDIVVMDMQMPVLDGPTTTRLLRATGFDRPIVALTARALETDRQKCLDAGCNAFLSKPVDREDLVRLLADHLAD